MSRWTDEQCWKAYCEATKSAVVGDLKGEAVIAGRRILDLEAELAQLRLEEVDSANVMNTMHGILVRTANALKGEPEPLSSHSWHDLPEVAAAMRPVVEAALFWHDEDSGEHAANAGLLSAVDAYRAQREGK